MRDIIETERLVLRPFVETDWKSLVNYAGDIDVARATGRLPHPYGYADAKNWIATTQASSSDHIYGIADHDNHLIGCISLITSDEDWEIGYWLGQRFWHQGFMREASEALLLEASHSLAPIRIFASVFKDNPRSHALLKALNFRPIEDIFEFCVARGHSVAGQRLQLSLVQEQSNA